MIFNIKKSKAVWLLETDQFPIEITQEKLRQALWLFQLTLPFDDVKIKNFNVRFPNVEFGGFMKSIIMTIRENYSLFPEVMATNIRMIKQMCDYVLEETKQWPKVDTDDLQKMIDHYFIQTNQWHKKHIVELEIKDGKIQCL